MLRITKIAEGTMKLEGRIAGPWVEELRRTVEQEVGRAVLVLDLEGVTYADAAGTELLRKLQTVRSEIRNASPFIAQLLAEPGQ